MPLCVCCFSIHPRYKSPIASRLALAASTVPLCVCCFSIHPRYKSPIASRLALAASTLALWVCCFSIHPRYKSPIASRLALAARQVAYGEQGLDVQGPFPTHFSLTGHSLVVEYDSGRTVLDVRANTGFEVEIFISLIYRFDFQLLSSCSIFRKNRHL